MPTLVPNTSHKKGPPQDSSTTSSCASSNSIVPNSSAGSSNLTPLIPTSDPSALPSHSSEIRFKCPMPGCRDNKAGLYGWRSFHSLQVHLQNLHLAAGEAVDARFLETYNRTVCSHCQLILVAGKPCHRCRSTVNATPFCSSPSPLPVSSLPSIDKILSTPIFTLRHVPAGVRSRWFSVMSELISCVTGDPSPLSLQLFLMAPKCLLFPLPRGGKSKLRQKKHLLLQRFELWEGGS